MESLLLASESGGSLARALVEAGRAARADLQPATAFRDTIGTVGASVVAPIFGSYVLWVLLKARQLGLRRLYFLARDGQPLHLMARHIAARLDLDIECRYLLGSRQSWIVNAAEPDDPASENWMGDLLWHRFRPGAMSYRTFAIRIGMIPERREDIARFPALKGASVDTHVDESGRIALQALLREPTFREVLAAHRRENAAILRDYLDQEGALADEPVAIVDSGWSGSMHRVLCRLREDAEVDPAHCFYFGFRDTHALYPEWADLRHWYQFADLPEGGDLRFRPEGLPEKVMISYVEIMATADHGTVLRLKRHAGTVVAEFETDYGTRVRDWGVSTLHAALEGVAAALDLTDVTIEDTLAIRPKLKALFEAFWRNPTPEEATAWGGFPQELGLGACSLIVPLARPFTLSELVDRARGGRDPNLRSPYNWLAGSFAMTPPTLALAVRLWMTRRIPGS